MIVAAIVVLVLTLLIVLAAALVDARRENKRLKRQLSDAIKKVDRQKQSRQIQFEKDDKQKDGFRRIIATLRTTLQGIGVEDPTKPKVPTEQTFSPADTPTKGGE